MPVNAVSRPFKLLINGLDFSAALESFTGSNSRLDQSGIVTFTGELFLRQTVKNLPGSLDPRLNTLWEIGRSIVVEIADTANTLQRHPRGALRILRVPTYNQRDRTLSIQVGDLLTLLNRDQPEGDKSGVVYGTATSFSTIIDNLIKAAGIPSGLTGSGPTFSLAYPVAKCDGSYIEQAGKLAYEAGWFLWCDNQEQIRAKRVDLAPSEPVITSQYDEDLVEYERLDSTELANPFELVRASGLLRTLMPIPYPLVSTLEQYSTKQQLSYSLYGGNSDPFLVESTTITINWEPTTRTQVITTEKRKSKTSFVTNDFGVVGQSFEIVVGDRSIEAHQFNASGLLAYTKTEIYQPETIFNPFASSDILLITRSTEQAYTYRSDGVISRITEQINAGKVQVYGQSSTNVGYQPIVGSQGELASSVLVPASRSVDTWQELYRDYWSHTTATFVAAPVTFAGANEDFMQPTGTTTVTGANAGPPSTETQPTTFELIETEIAGEARFDPFGGPAEFIRDEQIQSEYTVSSAQLSNLALIHGALKIGRAKGSYIASALDDWFLSAGYSPCSRHDVVEDARTWAFMRDGEVFDLDGQSCLTGVDGILLGEVV